MTIKRILFTLIVIGMAAALILSAYSTTDAAQPSLVGTWHIKVPDDAGQVWFEALHTYHADGTLTETSSELGLLQEGPAHGVWSGQGDDYNITFYLFTFAEETGVYTDMVRVRAKLHLDSPDHLTAQTQVDLIAPDGSVTPNVDMRPFEATRLTVEPLLNPLTIVQTYLEAINNKDLDTAISFLADDAVMTYPDGKFEGKEAIRKVIQEWLDGDFHNETSNFRESNGEVRYDYKVYFGEEMVDQNTDGLIIVKNGRIVFDGLEKDKPQ
jgi:hypothetical protein